MWKGVVTGNEKVRRLILDIQVECAISNNKFVRSEPQQAKLARIRRPSQNHRLHETPFPDLIFRRGWASWWLRRLRRINDDINIRGRTVNSWSLPGFSPTRSELLTEVNSVSSAAVSSALGMAGLFLDFFLRFLERTASNALTTATRKVGKPMPMPTPKLILLPSVIPPPICGPASFVVATAVVVAVEVAVKIDPDLPEELVATAEEVRTDDWLSVVRIKTVALSICSSMTCSSLDPAQG